MSQIEFNCTYFCTRHTIFFQSRKMDVIAAKSKAFLKHFLVDATALKNNFPQNHGADFARFKVICLPLK